LKRLKYTKAPGKNFSALVDLPFMACVMVRHHGWRMSSRRCLWIALA
jgi:hypothetical protein